MRAATADLTPSTLQTFDIESVTDETTRERAMAEDAKKSIKTRVDKVPTDGYILTVDGKLKTRYETEHGAAAEAAKLKQRFPVIQVSVYDARVGIYTPVDAQGQ
jgi:hypothetical protein